MLVSFLYNVFFFLKHIQDPATKINYFVSGAVDVVDPSMKNADKVMVLYVQNTV